MHYGKSECVAIRDVNIAFAILLKWKDGFSIPSTASVAREYFVHRLHACISSVYANQSERSELQAPGVTLGLHSCNW